MRCPRCKGSIKSVSQWWDHHKSIECQKTDPWYKVIEARKAGEEILATRLIRKALGIKRKPMSEETKAKLKQHNEEHKEEIKTRQKLKRAALKRMRNIRSRK